MKDEDYMRRALELSLRGRPSPNPYVGAVVVKDGRIVGEGYHRRAGGCHAEVDALKDVTDSGTVLYVTLEPCSHHGCTPPCVDAIVEAGVSEVVYAVDDPTEKVCGRERLEEAGVKVRSEVLAGECRRVNEAFFKHSVTGRPFVALKAAMTLDGQIASSTGESRWITSEESLNRVHELRGRYDAILVGVGTVLADDPRLTCRAGGGRDPLRVILDSTLRTPADARVLADDNVLVAAGERADIAGWEGDAEVIVLGDGRAGLDMLLEELGSRGVTSVLVEGGGTVNYSFVKQGLADKFYLFFAPKLMLGSNTPAFKGKGITKLEDAVQVDIASAERVGPDLLIEAYPK
ncbi:MAG: bifunctional diaminohydroxyphosphoribosylaminopyrimidine deaminase/5-amino-6-(5-phosphoribosylamino)uracil reductase RibD [Candidatus Altiarchaeales archaeon]|nr:bifunctional diaminohydroxyphosphoribosylaminopyrimidine deaminase/5-amino-6-(5-phosphoribosylamino)uracil reductase RibD [Candidatus Altiarchaeales archaeon]MBD3417055.1 bifunctional diaminohydroxyphosphoribosylaminopyrimidine deaminase/5-amino-6-(5-phosphoribosylamino)uracil reductase RibD [Candidatus Altiarchaeales archaeon]